MSRNALLVVALLLLFSVSRAARPLAQQVAHDESNDGNEVCVGVDEEECMARRTLIAHTDYIYTQGGNKKP